MATKADIRNRAAESLGVLPIGQALENQYKTRIDDAYAEVYAELKEEGLAYWSENSDIPAKFVPYVAALVANNALIVINTTNTRADRIEARAFIATRRIRELGAEPYVSETENVDF